MKNIGNYRKYDIFFNFRSTENMIFPSNTENHENMIFTLSVFTKMLFSCSECAIRLLAICNTKFVKKYGIDKVLTAVVEDINKFYEGYRMKILQNEILVFGKVLMYLGDTLGKHLWGGFKEGVGVSKQKCRHCYCEFNDMQLLFREDLFVSRTKLIYEANCLETENAETETERSELQKNYGINKRSYLTPRYYAHLAGGFSAI